LATNQRAQEDLRDALNELKFITNPQTESSQSPKLKRTKISVSPLPKMVKRGSWLREKRILVLALVGGLFHSGSSLFPISFGFLLLSTDGMEPTDGTDGMDGNGKVVSHE
jgi:hypothetical protein